MFAKAGTFGKLVTLLSAAAAAIVFALVATAAQGAHVRRALDPGNVRTLDSRGDAGAAPDIASLTVANDARRTISVQLAVFLPNPFDDSARYEIYVDADNDPSTGDAGSELLWALEGRRWTVERWTGTAWQPAEVPTADADAVDAGNLEFVTFSVNTSDLGGTAAVGVWARAVDPASGNSDRIPDVGETPYTIVPPAVHHLDVTLYPVHAVAYLLPGDTFSVTTATIVLDDGSTAQPESVACSASLAGRLLKPRRSCAWHVPRSAGGKTVVVVANAAYQGVTVPYRLRVPVLKRR